MLQRDDQVGDLSFLSTRKACHGSIASINTSRARIVREDAQVHWNETAFRSTCQQTDAVPDVADANKCDVSK